MDVVDEDAIEGALGSCIQALGLAALHRQDHVLDSVVGQLLGRIDCFADGAVGELEARHRARAHAVRLVQGGAEHLDRAGIGPRNDACHFRRADIKRCNQPAFCMRRFHDRRL